MAPIQDFRLDIPQSQLDDLNRRLDLARFPEKEPVEDWSQGVPLAELQKLIAYWRNDYDWRRCEARLNALGQFTTEIDGLDIYFLHVRSPHQDAIPLVMTHGWPGSVIEFMGVIERLTRPENFGMPDAQAFHCVLPALPGYGFSGKPAATGWNTQRTAAAWGTLMQRLGYERWVAQGGDWGAMVTTEIGKLEPEGCMAIHLNMPVGRPEPADMEAPGPDEVEALTKLKFYRHWDSGYSKQQSTRPQTIGYSLVDSPVGLAAWIFEKMYAWTDNRGSPLDVLDCDHILDNIMLYWLPAAGASAARLYWESFAKPAPGTVKLPTGVSAFPGEVIPAPRKWAERTLTNIQYWNEPEKGGHFAAWEQPEIFAAELRAAFAAIL